MKSVNSTAQTSCARPRDRLALAGLALAAFLACLPALLWHIHPSKDTAFFYSPMIAEIAAGNWHGGYFPFIPPLFTTIGAGIRLATRLDPFAAARVTSALFFALAVFPLHALLRLVYDRRVAWYGVLLYAFCPKFVHYAGLGLLDSGKTFFLILTAYATVQTARRATPAKAIFLGLAGAGLSLIKGEGIALAAAFLGGLYIYRACLAKGWRRLLPDRQLILAGVVLAFAVLPWVLYVQWQTGYPFTDGRQAWLVNQALSRIGIASEAQGALLDEPLALQILTEKKLQKPIFVPGWSDRAFFKDALMPVVKGFYPAYFPLLFLGLWLHRRRFNWRGGDGMLALIMILHTLLLLAVTGFTWTAKRYVIHAMPFMLGWAGMALAAIVAWLAGPDPDGARAKAVSRGGLALFFLFAILLGNGRAFDDLKALKDDPEVRACMLIKEWFARREFDFAERAPVRSTTRQYHNGRRPMIAGVEQRQLFFAGGDRVFLPMYGPWLTVEEVGEICRLKGVDLLLLTNAARSDDELASMYTYYPGLEGLDDHPDFQLLARLDASNAHVVEIYEYKPN